MSKDKQSVKDRPARLNALAHLLGARKYLEIGVNKGKTFLQVEVPYKVAVDPMLRFEYAEHADAGTIFHEVTSNAFFARHAAGHGAFDLIYLDGLHTYEQTLRDFCATLQGLSHPGTVWLIDDTVPVTWLSSLASSDTHRRLRKTFRIRDKRWMGDVFKVVLAIHDFFPQYSYATYSGHGQTAVWMETRTDFEPTWPTLEAIGRVGFREFSARRETHMNLRPDAEILAAVQAARSAREGGGAREEREGRAGAAAGAA